MSSSDGTRGKPGQPGNLNGVAADKSTHWQKGKSGNPSGRPSYAKALETNGTTSAELLAELVGTARKWLGDGSEPARQQYAHMWLTERILRISRPKEEMDLNVGGPSPEQQALMEALKLTPHERRKVIAQDSTEAHVED